MFWKTLALIALSNLAYAGENSKNQSKELWNGADYAKHSKVQETHFDRFFDYNSLYGCKKVLDIGCYDGKLTAKIAEFLKNGQVTGIDISQAMVQHAVSQYPQDKYPNLKFKQLAAQNFHLDEQFDYIISVHTMHWIKEQKETLKNIYNHLAPGGKVFILFAPSKEGLPFDAALRETSKNWAEELGSFTTNQYFFDTETYRKLLIEAGLHVDGIHYLYTETLHDDKIALGKWLKQWLPDYKTLPADSKEAFLSELVDNYIGKTQAARKEGPVVWGEYVIVVKASKR